MWNSYGVNVLYQWVSPEYWWIGIEPADSTQSCQSGAGQMGSREFITASLVECHLALTADDLPSTQSSKTLSSSSLPLLYLHLPSCIYYGLQGHGDETINISGMMRENSCNLSLSLSVPPLAVLQQVERSKQRGPLRCCWRGDWWSPLCCVL